MNPPYGGHGNYNGQTAGGRGFYGKGGGQLGRPSPNNRQLNKGPGNGGHPYHQAGPMLPPLTEQQQRQNEQEAQALLDKLRQENSYNPPRLEPPSKSARFFIIKSYSEDDVHRSIKYSIWCSTEHGNAKLDAAYRSQESLGPVYLFYSVNGSGHFCGVAQMLSAVDYKASSGVWAQDKWKGQFRVKWIYVKDVPNSSLKHIVLANNEYKPVTYSRDTQEVPHPQGRDVLDIIHSFPHTTSIFDDFLHYEKKQLEELHYRRLQEEASSAASSSAAASACSVSPQPAGGSGEDKPKHLDRSRTFGRPGREASDGGSSGGKESTGKDAAAAASGQDQPEKDKTDAELAAACLKFDLKSPVWADQWD